MKQILVAALLILLMSGIATASYTVETELPYEGTRNLPPDDSYAFFDFEMNEGDWRANLYPMAKSQLNGAVLFEDYAAMYYVRGNWTEVNNYWGYSSKNGRAMHVYPNDWFWDYQNDTNVPWIHLIEGGWNACPVAESWQPYPGTDGVISFPDGADEVSFLVSTGSKLRVKVYDKRDNLIEYVTVPRTIDRVELPDGPSTWARVTIKISGISWIHFSGPYNGWGLDDLCIGGLTLPEEPVDYSWAAERLKLLIGAPYNPDGFGVEFLSGTFYPAEDIVSNPLVVNWDYENKEWITGEGINNPAAIIWAFNEEANIINNLDLNDMASKDFKVLVEYGDQKPGDVAFIEYDTGDTSEGAIGYDEVIVFVEPHVDKFGMTVDCIRVSKEDGVHYSDSDTLHYLYGTTVGPEITSLFTVKSMPKTPKGNKKSPYPNIPGKFKI